MATHTVAAGRAWVYSHNIGRNAQVGLGFSQPVGVAAAKDGVLYVANRSGDQNPSSRISKVTVDHEFISEFGRQGPAYSESATSHFTWLTGVALDQQENVYTTDEWKSQVSIFDKEGELLQVWGELGKHGARQRHADHLRRVDAADPGGRHRAADHRRELRRRLVPAQGQRVEGIAMSTDSDSATGGGGRKGEVILTMRGKSKKHSCH